MPKAKGKNTMTDASMITDRVQKRTAAGLASATAERLIQVGADGFEVGEGTLVMRVVESPLDRLHKAGVLSSREFEAGNRLRELAQEAHVDPGAGGGLKSLDRVDGGGASGVPSAWASDRVLQRRREWRRLVEAINEESLVWTVLFLVVLREMALVDVGRQVFGRRDREGATVAATAGLRVALASLAERMLSIR